MRNMKLLMVVAALMVPLFWTGTLWAAEEPVPVNSDAINPGDPGPGGGIAPEIEAVTTESTVVTGTVVGTNCWLARGAEGAKYRDSAIACARNGTPLAILTDAGSLVYPITIGSAGNAQPDMSTLMSYSEQRVNVTGKLIKRGKEHAIIIYNVTAAPKPKEARTLAVKETPGAQFVGRVVDLDCWIVKGNAGTSDPKRVGSCAASGDPLVIASGGRIYYPVTMTMPKSPVGISMLSTYSGQKVRVTGTVIDRGEGRGVIIDKVAPLASE